VIRDRIRAWIAYEMKRRDIESIREFAELVEVNHAYLSRVISGKQTAGLELLLRLHQNLHISADRILDQDPPSRQ
jgi:transcriptional regulator with XRE-family HTH domain